MENPEQPDRIPKRPRKISVSAVIKSPVLPQQQREEQTPAHAERRRFRGREEKAMNRSANIHGEEVGADSEVVTSVSICGVGSGMPSAATDQVSRLHSAMSIRGAFEFVETR